jgi:hypothetical protein
MGMHQIELTSTRTRDECIARLELAGEAAHSLESGISSTDDPMLVSIRGAHFTVRNAADGPPLHSFRRVFEGEIVDRRDTSLIRGRFRLHVMARLSLGLWFGSMAAVVVLLIILNAQGMALPAAASGPVAILIPIVVLALAAMLVRSGLAQSRKREEAVRQLLNWVVEQPGKDGRDEKDRLPG